MGAKTRREFTDEFKREAVLLWKASGRLRTDVARELGIQPQPSLPRRWRRRGHGTQAPAAGGAAGRAVARVAHGGGRPLASVALLPALFALEAAVPPALPITSQASVEIAAPPEAVWVALTGGGTIAGGPGLVGAAGFAYPVRGRLLGQGVGAVRLGEFSTGIAREQVTEWVPARRLAFTVLAQPPAMEEMSPYRRVHSPHVQGYFETGTTRFTLIPLASGGTRLDAEARHVMRVEPVLYWEPLARLAIRMNLSRVLGDLKQKSRAVGAAGRRPKVPI